MSQSVYCAFIGGKPGVQGSKCAFAHPITGKIILIETSKNSRTWRNAVIRAMEQDKPEEPLNEAVYMWFRVYVHRPLSHYYASGKLRFDAPKYPPTISNKDMDKTERAIGDAAQKAKWVKNDTRIGGWNSLRLYTDNPLEPERVEIMMYSLERHGEGFIDSLLERIKQPPIDVEEVAVEAGVTIFE